MKRTLDYIRASLDSGNMHMHPPGFPSTRIAFAYHSADAAQCMREPFSNKNDNMIYVLAPQLYMPLLQFLECYLYRAFFIFDFLLDFCACVYISSKLPASSSRRLRIPCVRGGSKTKGDYTTSRYS
jgi:hypothetical protein